jgi:hypothetical protein
MHMQKMANIRNVFQPILLMAEGVILVMTKLKSHWVAAGERCQLRYRNGGSDGIHTGKTDTVRTQPSREDL